MVNRNVQNGWRISSQLVQVMACHMFRVNPQPKPLLSYCWQHPYERNFSEILIKLQIFSFKQMQCKYWQNGSHFVWPPCVNIIQIPKALIYRCLGPFSKTETMREVIYECISLLVRCVLCDMHSKLFAFLYVMWNKMVVICKSGLLIQ